MKYYLLLCFWFAFALPVGLNAQSKNSTLNLKKLDAQLPVLMKEAEIPGLSIAVIKNGKTVFAKGYGWSNTQTIRTITNNTVFGAASLGKPVLGYLALKLVDEGILSLDAQLMSFSRDDFSPEMKSLADSITVRMVLTHTTGLPNKRRGKDPLKFSFWPGKKFSYSGEGIYLLQQIIENVTKLTLGQLMNRYIYCHQS